jgi:hypothetical protein
LEGVQRRTPTQLKDFAGLNFTLCCLLFFFHTALW